MNYIGVTGTNGKTSVTHFLTQALHHLGAKPFLIGTLGHGFWPNLESDPYTTPPPNLLSGYLEKAKQGGATHVIMEVSSHGLVQNRVADVPFDIAVLTNLTQDHLDYHGTMEAYAAAKAKLFFWPSLKYAVLNADETFSPFAEKTHEQVKCYDYGQASLQCDVKLLASRQAGLAQHVSIQTPTGMIQSQVNLVGHFNLYNILAMVSSLHAMGYTHTDIAAILPKLRGVKGRMEYIQTSRALAVIDYAHTPDALEKALTAARSICTGKLWVVFGCGGERDKDKRAKMAVIAENNADYVVVTEDNSRREKRTEIIRDILAGFASPDAVKVEPNRKRAIRYALEHAQSADVVFLAGKGHETTMHIRGRDYYFDERECC